MKITEEMVERFRGAGFMDKRPKDVEWALYRALESTPDPEPLSDELRADAHWTVNSLKGTASKVATELLRRCPKPEPKQRTAQELHRIVCVGLQPYASEALSELVALAEKNK